MWTTEIGIAINWKRCWDSRLGGPSFKARFYFILPWKKWFVFRACATLAPREPEMETSTLVNLEKALYTEF